MCTIKRKMALLSDRTIVSVRLDSMLESARNLLGVVGVLRAARVVRDGSDLAAVSWIER
jgi:hypothetical protein